MSRALTVVLVHEPMGEVLGITLMLRDVTARWEWDQAMPARLVPFARHAEGFPIELVASFANFPKAL